MKRIKAAVVGVGYFGKFHAEKFAELDDADLVCVVDTDAETAQRVGKKLGVPTRTDYREVLGEVDAVSIVVPTKLHHEIAYAFLERGAHVLLEKPMTATVGQAEELIALASARKAVLQIGHVERINAVLRALDDVLGEPLFIESHRVAPFKPRNSDVDVILDLMIHDIDIVQTMARSPIEHIDATGAAVLSKYSDIANARIRFRSGCVANLTASRASFKVERKMRVFQRDSYIGIDFQNRTLTVRRKGGESQYPGVPEILAEDAVFEPEDTLKAEIAAFLQAIGTGGRPVVSGEEGLLALQTAIAITERVKML